MSASKKRRAENRGWRMEDRKNRMENGRWKDARDRRLAILDPRSSILDPWHHGCTSLTERGDKPSRNRRVSSRANLLSADSMQRKKRSRLANAKRSTLKTG